jgi:hypothetical protein
MEAVAGLDVHEPDEFVPVIGLIYLGNLLRAAEIERQCNQLWPGISAKGAPLVLLNDVWRKVPPLQPEIMDMARTSHVVVADALSLKPGDLARRVPAPAHLITVSPAPEKPEWIRVEIHAV